VTGAANPDFRTKLQLDQKGSAMVKTSTSLGVAPTEEQRAFVIAATACGLPREIICQKMPRSEGEEPLDPDTLDKHFAAERNAPPMLGIRLIIARVLFRALSGDDRDAFAAQMVLFKKVADWRLLSELSQAAEGPRIAVERLTRTERTKLRRLLSKAAVNESEREES
jgi:hypothetical protein